MTTTKKIKVTLTKSTFGRLQKHKDTVRGLGLHRISSTSTLVATPEVMGMVNKIGYMLKVEEVS